MHGIRTSTLELIKHNEPGKIFGTKEKEDTAPTHEVVGIPWRNRWIHIELRSRLSSQDGFMLCTSWLIRGIYSYPAVLTH